MDSTTIVAIYAALVSSVALIWNIIRERRRVKVILERNWIPDDETLTTGYLSNLGLRVTNDSIFPIETEFVGIMLKNKESFGFGERQIITPGMSHIFWVHKDLFREYNLEDIKYLYVSDSSCKKHRIRISQKILKELVID